MGISSPQGDLDCVCLFPNYINLAKHFFNDLFMKLRKQKEISDIHKVEHAKVPLLCFKYNQIDFDLSYCKINMPKLPSRLKPEQIS